MATKGYSTYLQNKMQDHLHGVASYSAPANVYFALFSVAPTEAGGGTEATGSGYSRKTVANTGTNWNTSSSGHVDNKTAITMATATGDWSTGSNQVAWATFDDPTAGNMLEFGPLTTPKPVLNGDTPEYAIGALGSTIQATS